MMDGTAPPPYDPAAKQPPGAGYQPPAAGYQPPAAPPPAGIQLLIIIWKLAIIIVMIAAA
jgi:hypothetical protein